MFIIRKLQIWLGKNLFNLLLNFSFLSKHNFMDILIVVTKKTSYFESKYVIDYQLLIYRTWINEIIHKFYIIFWPIILTFTIIWMRYIEYELFFKYEKNDCNLKNHPNKFLVDLDWMKIMKKFRTIFSIYNLCFVLFKL